jgi:hypothetical protein
MIEKQVKKYKCKYGYTSLVGVHSEVPVYFGNYCNVSGGPYLINMWAENLEALPSHLGIDEVEITELKDGKHSIGIVTDDRVPNEWLYEKLCITGHGWGTRRLCEAACEITGQDSSRFICGCERPEESPKYSTMMNFVDRIKKHHCYRCGRMWEC